jgi:hypothetical protein
MNPAHGPLSHSVKIHFNISLPHTHS